jgi:hypothetical protein
MFECTKEISSDMVIKEINKIMNKDIHNDTVTIILSHANTNEKKEILIELLNSIETKNYYQQIILLMTKLKVYATMLYTIKKIQFY